MDMIDQIVVKNIRRLMEERGLSQIEVSSKANISNVHFNKVLNGHRRAGPDMISAISKALECPVEDIYGAHALVFSEAADLLVKYEKATPSARALASEILSADSSRLEQIARALSTLLEDSSQDA